jgi:glycosyltransferase involved in cell wall biosynthesis
MNNDLTEDHVHPREQPMGVELMEEALEAIEEEDVVLSGEGLLPVKRKLDPLIHCVLPAFNEAGNLPALIPELCGQLAELTPNFEVLVVDDGSEDDTAAVTVDLAKKYPVRLLQLSRNFGKESALTAGLDHAGGDVVILMDADFQHPIATLPAFIAYWRQGYDMVYGIRSDRSDESVLKRQFSAWFYALMTRGPSTACQMEPNAGDFRLLDRKVVDALKNLPENDRFMKGLFSWVGFKTIGIPFQAENRRAGDSRFNFFNLSELAITGITSFTSLPLRLCAAFGAIVSLLSMLYGFYIVLETMIGGVDVPGWATLVVAICFLSGIQLLSIGILGEYIARIFFEAKQRPSYIIGRKYAPARNEVLHEKR